MEEKTTVAEETIETDSSKKFCTSCGAEIHAEAVICPSCGAGQGTETANEEKGIKKFITRFKTDKKLQAIAGGILATIVIVVIIAVCSYLTSFEHYIDLMLDEYPLANNSWAADGSEMNMDTNWYDKDPDDMTYYEYNFYTEQLDDTLNGIKWMNKKLGFSSSVYDDMMETNSLMGRQSASNDKYKVSWTYHPSKGLEVKYEKK